METSDVYYDPQFLSHDTGAHPENGQRLVVALQALLDSGIALEWPEVRPASVEAVTRVHHPAYVQALERMASEGGGRLDWDTAVSSASYDAALLAAGAGIAAVERAIAEHRRAFMLVRPPGHHARPSRGMGFCLFNNVAVAAAHALDATGLERVLIVDWDVHHGNGTHESFYADPRVLFFSMHEADHYPGTGFVDEVGAGKGEGFTINVPLRAGDGDGAVLAAFDSLLLPVAREFKPQLILVSAGYDGRRGDPLGDLSYSQDAFQWMTARLRAAAEELGAEGPLLFLEGGYSPEMLSSSIVATLRGLAGDEPIFRRTVSAAEKQDVDRAVSALRAFWPNCL